MSDIHMPTNEIEIEGNPLLSKTARIIMAHELAGKAAADKVTAKILNKISDEILNGMQLNIVDIWLYCAMLDTIRARLDPLMSPGARRNYENIKKEIGVTSIIAPNLQKEVNEDE